MAKAKKPASVIMIGNKKFTRGMPKPKHLPKYDFPVDFFEAEKPKEEKK